MGNLGANVLLVDDHGLGLDVEECREHRGRFVGAAVVGRRCGTETSDCGVEHGDVDRVSRKRLEAFGHVSVDADAFAPLTVLTPGPNFGATCSLQEPVERDAVSARVTGARFRPDDVASASEV